MRLVLVLASLLLVSPGIVSAQTVRSRTLDADGNPITSGTGAPTGTERGIHMRQVGEVDVNCITGCSTATDLAGTTTSIDGTSLPSDSAVVAMAGRNGVSVYFAAGTFDGTFVVDVSTDNETSWVPAQFGDTSTGLVESSITTTNPSDEMTRTVLFVGSITHARVRASFYNSGAANVTLRATTVNTIVTPYGSETAGGGLFPLPMTASTPAGTEMAPIFRCIGCTSTGGTNAADNTVWVYGTTAVTPSGFVYDTTPDTPTDGRVGAGRMDVNRNQQVTITGPDGATVVENTNGVKVTMTTVASVQGYNRESTGSVSSAVAIATVDTRGVSTLTFQVGDSCTCVIVLEGTIDGSTLQTIPWVDLATMRTRSSITNPAAKVRGIAKVTGYKTVQLRITSHSAGTIDGYLQASIAPSGINPTQVNCTRQAVVNTATGTTPVQFSEIGGSGIGGTTGEHVYICGIDASADGTTTIDIVEGTSSACASPVALSATHRLTAQTGWTRDSTGPIYKTTTSGRFVCLRTGSNIQTDVTISYEQF